MPTRTESRATHGSDRLGRRHDEQRHGPAAAGGGFDVIGMHTYATAGSFTLTTSISDEGGSSTSATATAHSPRRRRSSSSTRSGSAASPPPPPSRSAPSTTVVRLCRITSSTGRAPPMARAPRMRRATGAGPTSGHGDAQGLTPDTDYHVRLVASAPSGPVFGEDVAFHTAQVGPAPGLPPGLDFTWAPRADVLVAGAPAGGVQFQATPGPGVSYHGRSTRPRAVASPPTRATAGTLHGIRSPPTVPTTPTRRWRRRAPSAVVHGPPARDRRKRRLG